MTQPKQNGLHGSNRYNYSLSPTPPRFSLTYGCEIKLPGDEARLIFCRSYRETTSFIVVITDITLNLARHNIRIILTPEWTCESSS